jgi:Spy/CpxP family protein refolding chaperone
MSRSSRPLTLSLIAALVLMVCAADGSAQQGRRQGRERRAGGKRAAVARQLGLSETQRESMRAAAGSHREAVGEAREALRAAGRSLKAALAARPRDPATIEAARAAVRQARESSQAVRTARRAELDAALTPEQREQLAALKEARRARRAGR